MCPVPHHGAPHPVAKDARILRVSKPLESAYLAVLCLLGEPDPALLQCDQALLEKRAQRLLEGALADAEFLVDFRGGTVIADGPEAADALATLQADLARMERRAVAAEEDWQAREADLEEVVKVLEQSERGLNRMMETWLDYHDAHGLTEPVTGASGGAFDDALEARDAARALLDRLNRKEGE